MAKNKKNKINHQPWRTNPNGRITNYNSGEYINGSNPSFTMIYPDQLYSPAYGELSPNARLLFLDMLIVTSGRGDTFEYTQKQAKSHRVITCRKSFYNAISELAGVGKKYKFIEKNINFRTGKKNKYRFIRYNEEGSWYESWRDLRNDSERTERGTSIWTD